MKDHFMWGQWRESTFELYMHTFKQVDGLYRFHHWSKHEPSHRGDLMENYKNRLTFFIRLEFNKDTT